MHSSLIPPAFFFFFFFTLLVDGGLYFQLSFSQHALQFVHLLIILMA